MLHALIYYILFVTALAHIRETPSTQYPMGQMRGHDPAVLGMADTDNHAFHLQCTAKNSIAHLQACLIAVHIAKLCRHPLGTLEGSSQLILQEAVRQKGWCVAGQRCMQHQRPHSDTAQHALAWLTHALIHFSLSVPRKILS